MKIVVHIERLVLDGIALPGADRQPLRSSLEAELGRLLAAGNGMRQWRHGHALPSIRGGDARVQSGMSAARMGKEIAGAVHSGIGRIR